MSKGPYVSPSTGARKLGSSSTTRSPNVSNVFSRMTSKLSFNDGNQQHHRLKRYSSDDDLDDNKFAPREVSEHFKRYELMTEFINLRNSNHCPLGLYIMPSSENFNVWYGVLFVHKGYYSSGVFKFRVVISESYPEYPPSVTFMSDMFHPLIDVGGNLTICQQFLAWRPEESYIIHVLHYIKNVFKRAILDRLVDKICLNKDAYKLYRTDRNTFKKLARQCADLTITESYLFDHFPDDNLIKLSPISEMEFDDMRSHILPTHTSSNGLDSCLDSEEKEHVTTEAALYEKLLDKAREISLHEEEEKEETESMEVAMQDMNKSETGNNNGNSLAFEMADFTASIAEEKKDEKIIKQNETIDPKEDAFENDTINTGDVMDYIIEPTVVEIKDNVIDQQDTIQNKAHLEEEDTLNKNDIRLGDANQEDDKEEQAKLENIRDGMGGRDDTTYERDIQGDDKQKNTKDEVTKQESSDQRYAKPELDIQDDDIKKDTMQGGNGYEFIQHENTQQDDPNQTNVKQDDLKQIIIEQEDIDQKHIKQEEINQDETCKKITNDEETSENEIKQENFIPDDSLTNKDKDNIEQREATEQEEKIPDEAISEEIIQEEKINQINQEENIGELGKRNDIVEHESQENDNKPDDIISKNQTIQEVQDRIKEETFKPEGIATEETMQYEQIKQEESMTTGEIKQDDVQIKDEDVVEAVIKPEEMAVKENKQIKLGIEDPNYEDHKQDQKNIDDIKDETKKESKEKTNDSEEFENDSYRQEKDDTSDIQACSVDKDETDDIYIEVENKKVKVIQYKQPVIDTENNTPTSQLDNNSENAADKNSIENPNTNVKYQHQNDSITLQEEADTVAIRQP